MRRDLVRRAAIVVVLLLAVPAHPGALVPAGSIVSGRPRIVNGTLTSQYPTTGALLSPGNAETGALVCSGTLVGCSTFVTAAHCVCNGTGADCQGVNTPSPGGFIVFLQHAGFFPVSSIAVHPSFDFPVADVAVVHLATAVTGIAPTAINTTRAPGHGTGGTIVGFGRSGGDPGTNGDFGLKRAGTITTAACTAGVSGVTSVCWDFVDPLGPPGTNSDTCNGDSGGPLFIDFGCGPTLAGITSGGDSVSCLPTDRSYDANVFTYRAFVQAEAGADLDAESCGAMPQAGDPNTAITGFAGTVDPAAPDAVHLVNVPAGTAELRITLNAIDDGVGDFDLYVQQGVVPQATDPGSHYDCRAAGTNQFGACTFASPGAGPWYVLVHRFAGSGPYQVTATTFGAGLPGPGTDGQSCDDANLCTSSDVCSHANCGGAPVADGTPCDDARVCTSPDSCEAGTCMGTAALATGCRQPDVAGRASLVLRDPTATVHDRLTWKWTRGTTPPAELGNPATTSAYDLCVYDESAGVPEVVFEAHLDPSSLWTPFNRGWKFKDRDLTSGLASVVLKSGASGSASIVVKGKGSTLVLPDLPLEQDGKVTVQLRNDLACWEARYSTSTANRSDLFRAKAD